MPTDWLDIATSTFALAAWCCLIVAGLIED